MVDTRSESEASRLSAISFSPFQNASSRLTLVLCPAMTMDLLTTCDFIYPLPIGFGDGRACGALCLPEPCSAFARPSRHRAAGAALQRHQSLVGAALVCEPSEG